MNRSHLAIASCLLASAQTASGFSSARCPLPATSTTRLHSLSITEDQYPRFLSSASLCANSDTCSIDAAESYLREIVRIESACAAGTMSGGAVCEDVGRVSEVVAGLRDKIREGAKRKVKTFWQQRQDEFETLVSSSIDARSNNISPVAALTQAPLKPAYLAIAALYAMAVIGLFQPANMDASLSGVVPFTTQEVWWAIRDGYVVNLMSAWFKHGGLVISDHVVGASPLSPNEVWWAIRDGYAADLMSAWFKHGGLVASDDFVAFSSLTPQEVWWSIRDGYSSNVL